MKKQMFVLYGIALIMLTLTSCGKDREAIKAAISESQVAALVEDALQENMAGMAAQIDDMVAIAQSNVSAQCGTTTDSTIVTEKQTLIGSAEYTTDYTWTLECEGDVTPLNYEFTCHSEGGYNNNRMTSNDDSDASWVFTGLSESVNEFTANGTYGRNGEQTFKEDGIYTESNLDIFSTNLKINKTTELITGGTAEVNASGITDNGESFDFEGQIVFLGDGKAKLTVNGKTFFLNL